MRQFLKILVFLILIIGFSCEGKKWFVNCTDCVEQEPVDAVVTIKLRDIHAMVSIKIYEGDLEDNILYDSFEAYGQEYTARTELNKKYTFTATYDIDGNIYIAVNSAFPGVKYEESLCENPCYYVYENVVDLRLKYLATGK